MFKVWRGTKGRVRRCLKSKQEFGVLRLRPVFWHNSHVIEHLEAPPHQLLWSRWENTDVVIDIITMKSGILRFDATGTWTHNDNHLFHEVGWKGRIKQIITSQSVLLWHILTWPLTLDTVVEMQCVMTHRTIGQPLGHGWPWLHTPCTLINDND